MYQRVKPPTAKWIVLLVQRWGTWRSHQACWKVFFIALNNPFSPTFTTTGNTTLSYYMFLVSITSQIIKGNRSFGKWALLLHIAIPHLPAALRWLTENSQKWPEDHWAPSHAENPNRCQTRLQTPTSERVRPCCTPPFYTAKLSPNQICELAYNPHPLLSKNITFSRLLLPHTPLLPPLPFRRNKNNNLLFAIRCDFLIMSSQNDEEWYKNNTAQQGVLGRQLHVKGQGYINSPECLNSSWCCVRKKRQQECSSGTSQDKNK